MARRHQLLLLRPRGGGEHEPGREGVAVQRGPEVEIAGVAQRVVLMAVQLCRRSFRTNRPSASTHPWPRQLDVVGRAAALHSAISRVVTVRERRRLGGNREGE
jgi:hypothetical protein